MADEKRHAPDVSREELLALADSYEAGLRKMDASGYEEFDEPRRNHRLIIYALRKAASAERQGGNQ